MAARVALTCFHYVHNSELFFIIQVGLIFLRILFFDILKNFANLCIALSDEMLIEE